MFKHHIYMIMLVVSSGVYADVQDYLTQADSLLELRQHKEAIKVYKKALKEDKQSVTALRGLGSIALHRREWGDLKKWSDKILDIKPDDLGALYHNGIAYRETAKFKGPALRHLDFSKSRKYLDAVITQDSLFADVLFQRAFLERRQEKMDKALQWAKRQVKAKPWLSSASVGLYKIYDVLLHIEDKKKVERRLKFSRDITDSYFLAELYRRNQNYPQADSIFTLLFNRSVGTLNIPLQLSRMRLALQQGDPENAQRNFAAALDAINNGLDAEFMFEQTKYIFSNDELQEYRDLKSPVTKKEFFRFFWSKRNPTPSAPRNPRALEHFRRMIDAENNYWDDYIRSPIKAPRQNIGLDYPEAYFLNEEFNDRGLIYIRHGEPGDRINTISSYTGTITETNESWLYWEREDRPEYLFHFLGNHWQLAPFLDDPSMLYDRLGFHPSTTRQAKAHSYLDHQSLAHENDRIGREAIYDGLTTDFHTWDKDIEAMETFDYFACFRGQGQKTQIELYTAVSLQALGLGDNDERNSISFENSGGLYDSTFTEIARSFEIVELTKGQSDPRIRDDYFNHRFIFESDTGSYQLGFYLQSFDAARIGGRNIELTVPDMRGKHLNLSDLLLAYDVHSDQSHPHFIRNGMTIMPNATKTFLPDEPVRLYFEIYNLTRDENGMASFEVESTIARPGKGKTKFLGLFGGSDKGQVSITDKRGSAETEEVQHMLFDVSRLKEGDYELTVRVHDLNSSEDVFKSIALELKNE